MVEEVTEVAETEARKVAGAERRWWRARWW